MGKFAPFWRKEHFLGILGARTMARKFDYARAQRIIESRLTAAELHRFWGIGPDRLRQLLADPESKFPRPGPDGRWRNGDVGEWNESWVAANPLIPLEPDDFKLSFDPDEFKLD